MSDVRPLAGPAFERDLAAPVSRWLVVRFIVLFGLLFALLLWLLDGTGPVPLLNEAVHRFTGYQTLLAGTVLGAIGENVTAAGNSLVGPGFNCTVDTGCNGMSAVILLAAGILSFPAPLRRKAVGFLLLPIVLLINVLRIAGLYWTGVHSPDLFGSAHVYGGQVIVILLTVSLWLGWLTWASSTRARS